MEAAMEKHFPKKEWNDSSKGCEICVAKNVQMNGTNSFHTDSTFSTELALLLSFLHLNKFSQNIGNI